MTDMRTIESTNRRRTRMPWVLIPLAALALAGWKIWLGYKKGQRSSDDALLQRISRTEAALQTARERIANLETIVLDNLDSQSEAAVLRAPRSDADRIASVAARTGDRLPLL